MKTQLIPVILLSLATVSGVLWAKERPVLVKDTAGLRADAPTRMFGTAQVETTWIGADAAGKSVLDGGVWDFDNRGALTCPTGNDPSVYIKNGAFAQGWESEDVFGQKGLYWHAQDFTDAVFECSTNPIAGNYSAWCGRLSTEPGECFAGGAGYGHNWNQWLCRTVKLDPVTPTLTFRFNSDTEASTDFAYVFIDVQFPDSCGWVGELADTLRCYDGTHGTIQEVIDLSDLCGDSDLCDAVSTCDYSGDSVKICFVVFSDEGWDDEDGRYDSCDGAMAVDDISIDVAYSSGEMITTDFENGTLDGWDVCGGWSPGDYTAIRSRDSFVNNDPDLWQDSDIAGCVLTFYDPDVPGEYDNGGHYSGVTHKRAWSPPVYTGAYPARDYLLSYDAYLDLEISDYIFYRRYVKYVQDPECPTGAWSEDLSDGFIHYSPAPRCTTGVWDFSEIVPADAESVKIGLSVWNACDYFSQPCGEGNESPIFDNVRFGVIANINPEVTVLAPNGGEIWCVDDVEDITWTATDGNGVTAVDIYYSTDGGGVYTLIASGEENDGVYPWTIPNELTENALVKVEAYDPSLNVGEDVGDAVFRIAVNVPPVVNVTAPNGGENWYVGESREITWTATDVQGVDSLSIYYSINGGADFTLIASGEPNDGTYSWTVPDTPSGDVLVKVEAYDPSMNVAEDVSDAAFAIVDGTPPEVAVSAPNGGEAWYTGEVENITWTATDSHGITSVSIYYSADGGDDYLLVASGEANDGEYPWNIPNMPTDSALVKVIAYDPGLNAGEDTSDSLFTILESPYQEPLSLTVSIHQNPELTSEIEIYLVPSEALQDTSVWLGVNGIEKTIVPSDPLRSIYRCSHRLSSSGPVAVHARARDLDGNLADTTRSFGAGLIEQDGGGCSESPSGRIALICQPYSVKEDSYVLVLPGDGPAAAGNEAADVEFVLSPPALELDRPARLTVKLHSADGPPRLWREEQAGWESVESSYSESTITLSALVRDLGRYRVTWEEEIGGEARAALSLMTAPNPFRRTIGVNYCLPAAGAVRLAVYDAAGRKVRTLVDNYSDPGWHGRTWDGTDENNNPLPSGVYFAIIEAGQDKVSKKCVLIR